MVPCNFDGQAQGPALRCLTGTLSGVLPVSGVETLSVSELENMLQRCLTDEGLTWTLSGAPVSELQTLSVSELENAFVLQSYQWNLELSYREVFHGHPSRCLDCDNKGALMDARRSPSEVTWTDEGHGGGRSGG